MGLQHDGVTQKELVINGVFVRVYNEQHTFPLTDAGAFCRGLVTYIHNRTRQDPGLTGDRPPRPIYLFPPLLSNPRRSLCTSGGAVRASRDSACFPDPPTTSTSFAVSAVHPQLVRHSSFPRYTHY